MSDDSQSLQDLNDIIDQLEQEELEAFSLDVTSSPDEEMQMDWDECQTPSPDITIAPEVSSQPYLVESDLNCSLESASPPPPSSLDCFYSGSLIENSEYSIEKVLGPTTANILAEVEAQATNYANGLHSLEIECSEDANEPHRLLTCQICQLFVQTVDRLLGKSDQLMGHCLPLTEEEIASLKKTVQELDNPTNDHEMRVCFSRISNLVSKLRQRAYMITLSKLRLAQKNTENNLTHLQQTIDLIGQVQCVDAMDYPKNFEKLTEISIQWCQRHSLPQSMSMQTETLCLGPSIDEIGHQRVQSSNIEDLGVSIAISSKVEEKEELLVEGETLEMVPTFSTEIHYTEKIEVVPSEEVKPPPEVSSEKLPSPPAEVEPEVPPEVEPEIPPSPPAEVEPEVPPGPPEVEPEIPPSPPAEVEPEVPPGPPEVEPEVLPSPPAEVEPEVMRSSPEEVEPEVPPSPPAEVEPEVPPSPPPEVEPEKLPTPPPEVEPEMPPTPPPEVEPEMPPTPPPEVEPEMPPTPPPEVEPEKPPTPPPEVEPEKPPTPPPEEEPEKPPTPPPEEEPEKPPTPPPEEEPEKPPTPPPEVEPEKPPTPPPEVEPEKPPTPPPEVEPEKPPTPPPEVVEPPVPEEPVQQVVAHVTLITPGCDDELLLRMARSEEEFASESLYISRRIVGHPQMENLGTGYSRQGDPCQFQWPPPPC